MRIVLLAFPLALAACKGGNSDPDRVVDKCIRGHNEMIVDDIGAHSVPHEVFVCDESIPLVRYRHQTFKLGDIFTGDF